VRRNEYLQSTVAFETAMSQSGLSHEIFLSANPEDIIQACRQIGSSLDLVVTQKPRNRLVLRGRFADTWLTIDVEVVKERAGSRVFLVGEPHALVEGRGDRVREYDLSLVARVRELLETAFHGPDGSGLSDSQGAAKWPGIHPAPAFLKYLAAGSSFCVFAGCFFLAGAILAASKRSAYYFDASLWMWAVGYGLQTLRRHMIRLLTKESYLFLGVAIVMAIAWTVLQVLR
jgi:hypothetical protein